ncbi:ubiquitin domain-containing protein 1 [Artemisia annua]|uniref:Ubiquitin domain-containing protein 1 n=1 Tax=Artemisia annua TaxID=35608 RepID=A0A2U1QJS8_ARTAN|nr:ubiquitin domain-containing protein 1 [Artemisia annua]
MLLLEESTLNDVSKSQTSFDSSSSSPTILLATNSSGQKGRKTIRVRKPGPWRQQEPAMTRDQLNAMQDEFWNTLPIYGGRQEIWDTLRQAAESELHIAQSIIDSHGIVLHFSDMTVWRRLP